MVVRDMGVQLTVIYESGHKKVRFIDKSKIRGVVLNEGITMHRVIVYMAFLVHGQQKMAVAFRHLRPSAKELTNIYLRVHKHLQCS